MIPAPQGTIFMRVDKGIFSQEEGWGECEQCGRLAILQPFRLERRRWTWCCCTCENELYVHDMDWTPEKASL